MKSGWGEVSPCLIACEPAAVVPIRFNLIWLSPRDQQGSRRSNCRFWVSPELTGESGSSGADAPAPNLRVKMSNLTEKQRFHGSRLTPANIHRQRALTGRPTLAPAAWRCGRVRERGRERERERSMRMRDHSGGRESARSRARPPAALR